TTQGFEAWSLSLVASATTRSEQAIIARFTCASPSFAVVTPATGSKAQTPRTQASARIARKASTATGPTATCSSLSRRPPTTITSALGGAANAIATGGACVTTTPSQFGGR